VRPCFNPTLTVFSIALTAIRQDEVDAAPSLEDVLPTYVDWLRGHGLVDASGAKLGAWCFCTWSDADIGGQLAVECRQKGLRLPPCFANWVDLKELYRRHFKLEPKGGLRKCVERLPGLIFDGRAHNGLIDSRNTAKIALFMARGDGHFGPAFVFRRPTRGLDANGHAHGSKASREASLARGDAESGAVASSNRGTSGSSRHGMVSLSRGGHGSASGETKRGREEPSV
jgi:inhibitor of KinA sporulation pathway (predicted exonuclease)